MSVVTKFGLKMPAVSHSVKWTHEDPATAEQA